MWGTSRRWVPSGPALCAYGRPGTPEPREWELIDGLLNRTSILKSLAKDDLRDPPYHDIALSDPAFTQLARRFSGELFRRSGTFARRHLAEGCPLLVAGGCGLDCDWNSAWKASGLFADVFVPPCANDTGSAIGTAVDAMRGLTGRAKVEWSVYAGAGSIGLQVVRERERIEEHVDLLVGAVEEARRVGKHEFEEPAGFPRIVAEEMTVASTRPWFEPRATATSSASRAWFATATTIRSP
jgi:predicted NodU family carbamoyl transferase